MSIQIGDVNLVQSALDLEFRVLTLENLLDHILQSNQVSVTQEQIDSFRAKAIETLKGKYPNMGIKKP